MAMFELESIDLAISDVIMPDVDELHKILLHKPYSAATLFERVRDNLKWKKV